MKKAIQKIRCYKHRHIIRGCTFLFIAILISVNGIIKNEIGSSLSFFISIGFSMIGLICILNKKLRK